MINAKRYLEGRFDNFSPPFTEHDKPRKHKQKSQKSSENAAQIIRIFGLMTCDDEIYIGDLCIGVRHMLIKLQLEALETALVVEEVGIGDGAHLKHSLLSPFFADPCAHGIIGLRCLK